MSKWEYRRTDDLMEIQMAQYGDDGWELIAVVQRMEKQPMGGAAPGKVEMFWKREVRRP